MTIAVAANSPWHITNFRLGLVRALAKHGFDPVIIAPGPVPRDVDAASGIHEWIEVPLSRWGRNPVTDLGLLARYRDVFRRRSVQAMLSFTIKPNIYGGIAARLAGIPAIPNITGLGMVFARPGVIRSIALRLYRLALRKAPVVFFQNQADARILVKERAVTAHQVRLLPGSGVDLDRFKPVPLPAHSSFLLIARLLTDKGLRQYAEAAQILRDRGLDPQCRLLGPLDAGNPSMMSEADLQAWVSKGVIDYLGETDDVRPFIADAAVIVLPTFYNEGVPRALLEGAAMGRPLITTDIAGCRDVVRNGIDGFLCAPRDAVALADAMERMMKLSPDDRAAMGRSARALVEGRFDERFVIDEYLAALKELFPAACGRRR